ncbi:unnamed protein product [Amaranthus hypochondriacus]
MDDSSHKMNLENCYSKNKNKNNIKNKEQEKFLPIANVGRIMKKIVPNTWKISKDAKETVQQCVSEFISFVTVEATDKCQKEKRKTINGDDIIWAITTLGFEEYVYPLKIYLNKYRDIEGDKLNIPKKQVSIDDQQKQQKLIQYQEQPHDHFKKVDYQRLSSYSNNLYSSTNSMFLLPQVNIPLLEQSLSSSTSRANSLQEND